MVDKDIRRLQDDEVEAFLDTLDTHGDGFIRLADLERALSRTQGELSSAQHNPSTSGNGNSNGNGNGHSHYPFLRSLVGSDAERIRRPELAARVRRWGVPSQKQSQGQGQGHPDDDRSDDEKAEEEQRQLRAYVRSLGFWRRASSRWAVRGRDIAFVALVVGTQLAFAVWMLAKYLGEREYREAFGWGLVMAKTCAGALCPTMFFLLLSMSRYLSTFLRRSYYISRFINWDLSQKFHIRISLAALALASLHAIGHLTGSFAWGSRPSHAGEVAQLLASGPGHVAAAPQSYRAFVATTPGWTGTTALGLFWLLALLSAPPVRRRRHEVFQAAHLLMFPLVGLLLAHGTAQLFQATMLGFFLVVPTALVVAERAARLLVAGSPRRRARAALRVLDADTLELRVAIPDERAWRYRPGQYVLLQVPRLSLFQWHPFSVSACRGRVVWLHIKTDGDWTKRLRGLAVGEGEGEGAEKGEKAAAVHTEVDVGIDGPFGAPAQRFYDFTHTIVVGAGIGVTPFAGILADLQAKQEKSQDGGPGFETWYDSSCSSDEEEEEEETSLDVVTSPEGLGIERPSAAYFTSFYSSSCSSVSSLFSESPSPNPSCSTLASSLSSSSLSPLSAAAAAAAPQPFAADYRRVDFHWTVRDPDHLRWFSDLLLDASRDQALRQQQQQQQQQQQKPAPRRLDVNIHTYVTRSGRGQGRPRRDTRSKTDDIATHVCRWLLEEEQRRSDGAGDGVDEMERSSLGPATGDLLSTTRFGRPDFARILRAHYEEMRAHHYYREAVMKAGERGRGRGRRRPRRLRVGVFFCGAPVVGEILADQCRLLTARARGEGVRIEYHFMMEVFG